MEQHWVVYYIPKNQTTPVSKTFILEGKRGYELFCNQIQHTYQLIPNRWHLELPNRKVINYENIIESYNKVDSNTLYIIEPNRPQMRDNYIHEINITPSARIRRDQGKLRYNETSALCEFIDNSIQYTDSLSIREIEVKIHTQGKGKIVIKDTGVGVSVENIKLLGQLGSKGFKENISDIDYIVKDNPQGPVINICDEVCIENICHTFPTLFSSFLSKWGVGAKFAMDKLGAHQEIQSKREDSKLLARLWMERDNDDFQARVKNEDRPDNYHGTTIIITDIIESLLLPQASEMLIKKMIHIYYFYVHGWKYFLLAIQQKIGLQNTKKRSLQSKKILKKFILRESSFKPVKMIVNDIQLAFVPSLIDSYIELTKSIFPFYFQFETEEDEFSTITSDDESTGSQQQPPRNKNKPSKRYLKHIVIGFAFYFSFENGQETIPKHNGQELSQVDYFWLGRYLPREHYIPSFMIDDKKTKLRPHFLKRVKVVLFLNRAFTPTPEKDSLLEQSQSRKVFSELCNNEKLRERYHEWIAECHEEFDQEMLFLLKYSEKFVDKSLGNLYKFRQLETREHKKFEKDDFIALKKTKATNQPLTYGIIKSFQYYGIREDQINFPKISISRITFVEFKIEKFSLDEYEIIQPTQTVDQYKKEQRLLRPKILLLSKDAKKKPETKLTLTTSTVLPLRVYLFTDPTKHFKELMDFILNVSLVKHEYRSNPHTSPSNARLSQNSSSSSRGGSSITSSATKAPSEPEPSGVVMTFDPIKAQKSENHFKFEIPNKIKPGEYNIHLRCEIKDSKEAFALVLNKAILTVSSSDIDKIQFIDKPTTIQLGNKFNLPKLQMIDIAQIPVNWNEYLHINKNNYPKFIISKKYKLYSEERDAKLIISEEDPSIIYFNRPFIITNNPEYVGTGAGDEEDSNELIIKVQLFRSNKSKAQSNSKAAAASKKRKPKVATRSPAGKKRKTTGKKTRKDSSESDDSMNEDDTDSGDDVDGDKSENDEELLNVNQMMMESSDEEKVVNYFRVLLEPGIPLLGKITLPDEEDEEEEVVTYENHTKMNDVEVEMHDFWNNKIKIKKNQVLKIIDYNVIQLDDSSKSPSVVNLYPNPSSQYKLSTKIQSNIYNTSKIGYIEHFKSKKQFPIRGATGGSEKEKGNGGGNTSGAGGEKIHAKGKWIGESITIDGKRYYYAVEYKGEIYQIGDYFIYNRLVDRLELSFGCIIQLYELEDDPDREQYMSALFIYHPSYTDPAYKNLFQKDLTWNENELCLSDFLDMKKPLHKIYERVYIVSKEIYDRYKPYYQPNVFYINKFIAYSKKMFFSIQYTPLPSNAASRSKINIHQLEKYSVHFFLIDKTILLDIKSKEIRDFINKSLRDLPYSPSNFEWTIQQIPFELDELINYVQKNKSKKKNKNKNKSNNANLNASNKKSPKFQSIKEILKNKSPQHLLIVYSLKRATIDRYYNHSLSFMIDGHYNNDKNLFPVISKKLLITPCHSPARMDFHVENIDKLNQVNQLSSNHIEGCSLSKFKLNIHVYNELKEQINNLVGIVDVVSVEGVFENKQIQLLNGKSNILLEIPNSKTSYIKFNLKYYLNQHSLSSVTGLPPDGLLSETITINKIIGLPTSLLLRSIRSYFTDDQINKKQPPPPSSSSSKRSSASSKTKSTSRSSNKKRSDSMIGISFFPPSFLPFHLRSSFHPFPLSFSLFRLFPLSIPPFITFLCYSLATRSLLIIRLSIFLSTCPLFSSSLLSP